MKLTKKKIQEIIDSDGNMIGINDKPEVSSDIETQASKTTDYNANAHQKFDKGFFGRFGFYFYESEGDNNNVENILAKIMYEKYKETLEYYNNNPDKLKSDWKLHNNTTFEKQPEDSKKHDYEWASDILKALAPHMKKEINEGSVDEKILPKKEDKLISKDKDTDIVDSKMRKVADLLDKLSDNEIDKLITVLENKRKK